MKCPRCDGDLRRTDFGEHGFVILDICPSCDGTWFDKGELDRLDSSVWVNVEEDVEFRPARAPGEALACPKCQKNMEPISPKDQVDLVVDRCTSCDGFWLDKGELEKMHDVVDLEHKELHKQLVHFKRPPDWSLVRWLVYRYITLK